MSTRHKFMSGICSYLEDHGFVPSRRELTDMIEAKSVGSINYHVAQLSEAGWLKEAFGRARGIKVAGTAVAIPWNICSMAPISEMEAIYCNKAEVSPELFAALGKIGGTYWFRLGEDADPIMLVDSVMKVKSRRLQHVCFVTNDPRVIMVAAACGLAVYPVDMTEQEVLSE